MPESKNNKTDHSDRGKMADQIVHSIELGADADYQDLLKLYQKADFTKCQERLAVLEQRYPGNPWLRNFNDDLQVKLTLKSMTASMQEGEKTKRKKKTFNLSVFAAISAVVIIAAFVFSFIFLNRYFQDRRLQAQTAQLSALYNQANQLLLAGQPQPAAEIVELIRSVNPNFENFGVLTTRTENLLQWESIYQTALGLAAGNQKNEALILLKGLEKEQTGLWDVSQQIAAIETHFLIEQYLAEGSSAYQVGNWEQVIYAYENAFELDPDLDDPFINEQLLKGYLNKIISMLDKEFNTIEEIEKAEEYYRKALAMTPQSRAFASERSNLQKIISNLLEQKFAQIGKASLEDKNQNVTSIAGAVSYIRKAANINPENTYLQTELQIAGYYQIAFNNFIEMSWSQAVTNLELIESLENNYAKGNANLLLFEAYHGLAKQFYALGLYLDAIRVLEKAEILAWDDTDNLMKLFQVQVFLGDAIGRVGNYENAVSYYQYALNAVNANQKLAGYRGIAAKLAEANAQAANANYADAFAAYQDLLQEIDVIYTELEIRIDDGVNLAFFANENQSTVDAILEANNLPRNMVITFGRDLKVPRIVE